MSYLEDGFDNNLIRNTYPDNESFEDSSILGEIITAGAIPTSEITSALVANGIINTDNNIITELISATLNTQAKEILSTFTFGTSGAIAMITDANNGIWISPTGILAKKGGNNTFALGIDGVATFAGNLSAPSGTLGTITAGTITGVTIQSAATGYRSVMTSGVGYALYNGATYLGKMSCSAAGSIIIDSLDNIYFRDQSVQLAQIDTNGLILPSTKAVIFTGGGRLKDGGAYLKVEGAAGGVCDFQVEGNVYPNADNARQCGTSDKRWQDVNSEDAHIDDIYIGDRIYSSDNSQGIDSGSKEFVTTMRYDSGAIEYKHRSYTFKDGLLVAVGDESGWHRT